MYSEKFDFNSGLIGSEDIKGDTNSERALYYGGWNLDRHTDDNRDVKVFKAFVPSFGAYRVTITINNASKDIRGMKVFAGRRNLMLASINVDKGESYTDSFITYVSPYYPAMSAVICDEKALYVSITGEGANLSDIGIEEVDVPTVFVAGDSTLTDQNAPIPYYAFTSCCGWAQLLGLHFKNIAICNQAHSGMTTNCFRDDGHWDIVKKLIKKGDVFIMQFGHNDQKRRNLAAFGGYINNLRWYVNEVRKLGGVPIIASPISRIPFIDRGEYHSLLETHALACKQAACELGVGFVDLHERFFEFLCDNFDSASDYFIHGDITHTNEYGAGKIAEFFADDVARKGIGPLCEYVDNGYVSVFEEIDRGVLEKAETSENSGVDNRLLIPMPYVDVDRGMDCYAGIKVALENWLLDPCVMHLHPDEVMPRGQFLMVYFKALRISGKRPYLGEFCDLSRYEWDSGYVEACVEGNLVDATTVAGGRFRPDEALTVGEFASFCVRGIEGDVALRRGLSLEVCFDKAREIGVVDSNALMDAFISRAECYLGLVRVMEVLGTIEEKLPEGVEVHPVG
jgi:lysophospholipase L1-like esterase